MTIIYRELFNFAPQHTMVTVQKILYKGEIRILFTFPYDEKTKSDLKKITGIVYSKTLQGWHAPYHASVWREFLNLQLVHNISEEKEQQTSSLRDSYLVNTPSKTVSKPSGNASPNTATSDNAGIMSDHHVVHENSVHPSNADRKDTDIRIVKSGREVLYSGGNFVLSIPYNESDVNYLKSLKSWWNPKAKKWLVKANEEVLLSLQSRFDFWNEESFAMIHDLVLQTTHPYVVTLYRLPDDKDHVMIQISGHKANIDIVRRMSERCYMRDNKRWQIPNHAEIIARIEEEYIRDGAIV